MNSDGSYSFVDLDQLEYTPNPLGLAQYISNPFGLLSHSLSM